MKLIQKKLKEWLDANIINIDTYNAILTYENHHVKQSKNLFVLSLFIIAYISIGIGILSMISANWENIPAFIKFFVLITFHILIAYLILKFEHKINLREGLLLLFQFLFLGEIALSSQVFQLEGKLQYAFLFWGILMIFPSLLSKYFYLPLLNFIILHLSSSFVLMDFMNWDRLHPVIFSFLLSYVILLVIYEIFIKFLRLENFKKASIVYSMIFYLVSLIWFHILWYLKFQDTGTKIFLFLNMILILFSFVIFFLSFKNMIVNYTKVMITLIFIFIFLILNYSLSSSDILVHKLTKKTYGTILLILILILTSYIVLKFKIFWLFHILIFMILVRIWIVYVEIFENLTYTGFGLSLFGLLILISIFLYRKIIKNILQKEQLSI